MTHQRIRFAEKEISKALSYSPCVGLVGMRQVGKSTLLKKFAKSYQSFDDDAFLRRFDDEKTMLLEQGPGPIALDEIQKHPPVFDALKLTIDRQKRMGRFLVSGSVRFASRKQIRESLTGRIVALEIFPLSLAECHGQSINPLLKNILTLSLSRLVSSLKQRRSVTTMERNHYLETGGLPGICFRRDASVRAELFEQHLDTLLRRDIHFVRQVRLSFVQLKAILMAIAGRQGLAINLSEIARMAGCSMPTIKNALEAMEGLFLVRPYGKTWFIEDAGLAHHLSQMPGHTERLSMICAAYYELRLQHSFHLRHEAIMNPYTTRGGIDVPFLFEFKNGNRLAILVDAGERASEKSLKSTTWMKKRFSKFKAIILTDGDQAHQLNNDCACLPLNWIF